MRQKENGRNDMNEKSVPSAGQVKRLISWKPGNIMYMDREE